MAIYKEIYRNTGRNAAAIVKNSDFVGRGRWRMGELDREKYGACNTLSMVNNSAQTAELTFYTGVETNEAAITYALKSGSIINIGVQDGISFYAFDVVNKTVLTDIAIGNVQYTVSKVVQIKEQAQ